MLDAEHEGYLRKLYGDTASEERIQRMVQELTNEEFWRRIENLQRLIIAAKRQHYLARQIGQPPPRRPS